MTCRWNGSTQPRTIAGRHHDACPGDPCTGCQPCTQPHCRVCGRAHADGTCADCLDEVRTNLGAIAHKCGALPTEATHRGVNSEAASLHGPTADPEARQHAEASYLAGRLPEGWLEATHGKECPTLVNEPCTGCQGSERHPLYVLGTWDACWRDALDHDEPTERLTIGDAIAYLDTQLTYMAGYPHAPFEDFAHDIRDCAGHLADVLHDSPQGDVANIGCFECGSDLERRLCDDGFEDFWTCRGCRRRYTYAEYNFALRAHLEEATTATATSEAGV